MKKVVLFAVAFLAILSYSQDEGCSISSVNKVLCKRVVDGTNTVSVYTAFANGQWMGKTFFPRDGERDKEAAVFVSWYRNFNYDSYSEISLNHLLDNDGNIEIGDSLKTAYTKMIKIMLKEGKYYFLPVFELYLENKKPVSEIHCFSGDYVRSYRYNNVTGLRTARKDYFSLKYRTHCEDFLANDEYFWYPPK